ncbi:gliding motility-associated C-terminal domain-containing protein [Flaviaesturariibacter amylovorans]|uniref:PKD domain-containing protein n=1 Tax=Flaviaesturariibacter amylovorans TaxID=1084520 RepID=A0ABP8GBZ1_9BACT
MQLRFLASLLLLLTTTGLRAQTCTTPGQTPATAFPVCGTSTFAQSTVPLCGGTPLPSPGCNPNQGVLTDVNPFWYKFTCFQSGTLGFLITPNNMSSDYDWELYDVTGRNPNDVFTDGSLVISKNWSGETGLTGASSAGTQQFVCGGTPNPRFSRMPNLIQGHNYLLLISHFTPTQYGYGLSFGGGTAVITDTTTPRLRSLEASCAGDQLRVKLNKKMKCSSLTGSGSEFVLAGGGAIVSATGIGCSNGFDTDSILLQLAAPLAAGNYTLQVRAGTDGNTLLDYCDQSLATTESLPITITPRVPTRMDSIAPVACAPRELRLVFKRLMSCVSVAPNGSDFRVAGTYPVTVTGATCADAGTAGSKVIVLSLSAPLQRAGAFQVILQRGTDGNTLIDECGEETPAGQNVSFSVKDTVNADFTYTIGYGCQRDTVRYLHPGANGVDSWKWTLDEGQESTLQNPTGIYAQFNTKAVELVVSNGFCNDTARASFELINFLKADFSIFEDNCPEETVPVVNSSVGRGLRYAWDFGDGQTSTQQTPVPVYAGPVRETPYWVRLQVTDSFGCTAEARKRIVVYNSCYVDVPNAFTPNNDGKNDRFRILNAVKAVDFELMVYNRWGQVVFQTNNWKAGWDGRVNGIDQGAGVYVWFARYTDRDTRKPVFRKGTMTLIR